MCVAAFGVALACSSGCSLLFEAAPSQDGGSALSAYEEAVLRSSPAAYYRAEEGVDSPFVTEPVEGLLARDETERFPGSYTGDVDLDITGAFAGSRGFRVRESGDSKLVPPTDIVNLNGDFTVELLFRPESRPEGRYGGIFIREAFEEFGFRFGIYADAASSPLRLTLWCHESGCSEPNGEMVGETQLQLLDWHHVVLVHYNDHRFEMYLNGQLEGARELPVVIGDVSRFQTGFGGVSGKRHTASFDDIAVYSRAFGDDEIVAHYNAYLDSR